MTLFWRAILINATLLFSVILLYVYGFEPWIVLFTWVTLSLVGNITLWLKVRGRSR